MVIEFKSQINQNGETNFIKFKAPVKIYQRNKFKVYEFEDLTLNGSVYFVSFLRELNFEDNKINFAYSLSNQNKTILGEYIISLQIFNELN